MGEANQRGTFEERRAEAQERELDNAECLIFLSAENGKLNIRMLPRDETPNQDSPAMIFAAYINANFSQLAGEAMALYESHAAGLPRAGVIAEAPKRSVQDYGGNIADGDKPRLMGPDGSPLQ